MEKEMKVAIYCRVSTKDQDVDKQEQMSRDYCIRNGHTIYKVYKDIISGSKESRPEFDNLLRDLRAYHFNTILVTKLDRIGRSLRHLIYLFEEFKNKGVNFIAITQSIDTTTATGKLQLHILSAFAEFERNLISERTKEGLSHSANRHLVGKRGKDKRPRKKRGGLRNPSFSV